MHSRLHATMAAATLTLLVALPASGDARATSHSCAHAGKEYVVQGTIDASGTLAQVAGASTKRTADDRFSGTVVVDVTQASRERDLGPATYVVTAVRLSGGKAAPSVGTKVKLYGTALSAAAARRCGVQEPTGSVSSTDSTDDAPPVVTGVKIRIVKLGHPGPATDASADPSTDDASTDDSAGDDTSSSDDGTAATDPSVTSDDDASDDTPATDASADDASVDASADGDTVPPTTPQPTTPAPKPVVTTPAATTPAPIFSLPGGKRH